LESAPDSFAGDVKAGFVGRKRQASDGGRHLDPADYFIAREVEYFHAVGGGTSDVEFRGVFGYGYGSG
jgi:hypothetical protein